MMRRIILSCMFFVIPLIAYSQAPTIVWDKVYGTLYDDIPCAIISTSDGGFVIAGISNMQGVYGDKSQPGRGRLDYWILKIDGDGNKVWDKTYGGDNDDYCRGIVQTSDGGFIVAGTSRSDISGDKTESNLGGELDYWIIKIDANGDKIWDKTIGGNGMDAASSIVSTSDGGCIIAGYSSSPVSGHKSEGIIGANGGPYGNYDYWIVKLNVDGEKVWDKTIGGDGNDKAYSIIATLNGGFLISGESTSNISGDKSENKRGFPNAGLGYSDYWIVKINENGLVIWDKTYGGFDNEIGCLIVAINDGGFVLSGVSYSDISYDKSENNKGRGDYWIVKIDADGQKIWDKTYGGNDLEIATSVTAMSDGGLVISGYSLSPVSGNKSEGVVGPYNYYDYWLVKVNAEGQKVWDKTFGGNLNDWNPFIVALDDGHFIVAGRSAGPASGNKSVGGKGGEDYWIIKLKDCLDFITHNNSVLPDIYKVSKTIQSSIMISSETIYQAGSSVVLLPGFQVSTNDVFEARIRIGGCD